MKRGYLLDTNHVSAAIRPISPLRDRLRRAYRLGDKLGICIPVVCELEVGIQQTAEPQTYRRPLAKVLEIVKLWPLDETAAIQYGQVFRELRQRGRVLSQVDMMLIALTRHMNLTLLTADKDFDALPDLRLDNWLL